MAHYLIEHGYIPLDKSWIIRLGVLDLLNGCDDTINFLYEQREHLSDDLQALYRASVVWNSDKLVDVGESGTLYRFLKFISWKYGLDKEFIMHGTLLERNICDDPEIVNYSLDELLGGTLTADKTSQWASVAVLCGNKEIVDNQPYKLELTHGAISYRKQQKDKKYNNQCWEIHYDGTILNQSISFLELLHKGESEFTAEQPEDYLYAWRFGFITEKEGESKWPSLYGHESNRIKETKRMLNNTDYGAKIYSKDPRAIEADVMWQKVKGKDINVKYPEKVNKNWPQFFQFIDDSSKLAIVV